MVAQKTVQIYETDIFFLTKHLNNRDITHFEFKWNKFVLLA